MPDALHAAVESLTANVDRIVNTVDGLIPAMDRLSQSSENLAKRNRGWKAMVITLVVIILGGAGLVWQVHRQSTCISDWANASTSRTGTLTFLSTDRSKKLRKSVDAEHEVTHYALAHPNGSAAQAAHEIGLIGTWDNATTAYQKADDAYAKAVVENPIPPSPKYACGILTF